MGSIGLEEGWHFRPTERRTRYMRESDRPRGWILGVAKAPRWKHRLRTGTGDDGEIVAPGNQPIIFHCGRMEDTLGKERLARRRARSRRSGGNGLEAMTELGDLLLLRIQVVQIELGGLDRATSEDLLEIVDVSAAPQIPFSYFWTC